MTFREMTVEDLEQVVEIENRLFSDPPSAQILERFTNSVRASVYVCLMLIKKMQQLILCLQLFGDKSETGGKIWEQNP